MKSGSGRMPISRLITAETSRIPSGTKAKLFAKPCVRTTFGIVPLSPVPRAGVTKFVKLIVNEASSVPFREAVDWMELTRRGRMRGFWVAKLMSTWFVVKESRPMTTLMPVRRWVISSIKSRGWGSTGVAATVVIAAPRARRVGRN